MDRRNYDMKAVALFDVLGSYFVDVFYNNHYILAKQAVQSGHSHDVTGAYRDTIISYMTGLSRRDDLYKKVVYGLHEFYQKNSGFGSVTLSEFQDRILAQFIPPQYYADFTERHKDNTMREIIIQTVNDFGELITGRDILCRVVDDHMNKTNVALLQDRIVDILIIQRENYYSKFVKVIAGSNGGTKVNKAVLDKLKAMFVEEKQKNNKLSDDHMRALNMLKQLIPTIEDYKSQIDMLKSELSEIKSENKGLKKQLTANHITPITPINNKSVTPSADESHSFENKKRKPKHSRSVADSKVDSINKTQDSKRVDKRVDSSGDNKKDEKRVDKRVDKKADTRPGKETKEKPQRSNQQSSSELETESESDDGAEQYRKQQEALKLRLKSQSHAVITDENSSDSSDASDEKNSDAKNIESNDEKSSMVGFDDDPWML